MSTFSDIEVFMVNMKNNLKKITFLKSFRVIILII